MITIQDKLESFKKIIEEDIISTENKEIEKLSQDYKEQVDEYQEEMEKKVTEKLKKIQEDTSAKIEKLKCQYEKKQREIEIEKINKICEDFMKSFCASVKETYMTQKGEQYLKSVLEKARENIQGPVTVKLMKDSFERDKAIVESVIKNSKVEVGQDIQLGGFMMEDDSHTYRLNYCLDFFVEQERDSLIKNLRDGLKEEV